MKDFTPCQEALELKKLEFDADDCFGFWNLYDYSIEWKFDAKIQDDSIHYIEAPLFSQAFRFFREKYNMLANVYSNASGFLFEWHDTTGGTHRYDAGFDGPNDSGCWDTYEDAEIACLRELIKIAKTKKP
jgi:hypothetical protein